MEIQKISEFSNYLASSPKSYNAIAQFLVLNTFREEEFQSCYIGEVIESGVVCPIGGFGWPEAVFDAFPNYPLKTNLPLTNSIKSNQIVTFKNGPDLSIEYPDLTWGEPEAWVSGIIIPVYPIGAMGFISAQLLKFSHNKAILFSAVGSLLGLYASRLSTELVHEAVQVNEKIHLEQVPLTDRQLVIAGLLERGFSNSEIALKIGYSESLVRHETMSIYKKLNVTGREAMVLIRTLHLENLKITTP
jgi:DNA-binding CsgD family transcriptional regulator